MKKISKIFMLLVIFIAFVANININAKVYSEDSINIRGDIGYDGVYKIDGYTPVNVYIKSNDRNIDGDFVIKVLNPNGNFTEYVTKVNLPKGVQKNVRTYIQMINAVTKLDCEVREGDKVLLKTKLKVKTPIDSTNCLVGVLSDNSSKISYLNKINPSKLNPKFQYLKLIDLDKDSFPINLNALNMFDVIFINDFDTSSLDNKQYEALKMWVENGGNLVIGTGASYAKTLSLFKDNFIKGTVQYLPNKGIQMKLENGNKETLRNGNYVYDLKKINGHVYLLSFDAKDGNSEYFQNKLDIKDSGLVRNIDNNNAYVLLEALRNVPQVGILRPSMYMIIFAIYIIIIPVIYFILKRFDKRQFMWGAFPLLSIIFTMIAYFSYSNDVYSKNVINTISYITVDKNGVGTKVSCAGIFTDSKDYVNVSSNTKENLEPIYEYGYSNDKNIKTDTIIFTNDDSKIKLKKSSTYEGKFVKFKNKSVTFKDKIECNVNYANGRYTGVIKNNLNSDIKEAYIVMPDNKTLEINDVKAKGSKSIDIYSKNIKAFNYSMIGNYYDVGNQINPITDSDEVIRNKRNKHQNAGILQYFFMDRMNGGLNVDNPTLIVFSENNKKVINVDDVSTDSYGKDVLVQAIDVTFRNEKKIEYPEKFIKPEVVMTNDSKGYIDSNNNTIGGRGEFDITYDLGAEKVEPNMNIEEISLTHGIYSSDIKEYILNVKTNSWEEINSKKFLLRSNTANNYMDKNRKLKLKININPVQNADVRGDIPAISLKGSVK